MSCPAGRARHWYTIRHTIGIRSPVCTECGSPNPRPLSHQEWAEVEDWARNYGVGRLVWQAINSRPGQEERHGQVQAQAAGPEQARAAGPGEAPGSLPG